MLLSGAQGHDLDVLSIEAQLVPSAAVGGLANTPLFAVPDLSLSYAPTVAAGSGNKGYLPLNSCQIRQIAVVPLVNQAPVATNSFRWEVWFYRGGALQGMLAWRDFSIVATTITPAITAVGLQTVAVASATGLRAGMQVLVDTAASQEQVTLLAVSGSNITAYFAKTHTASAALSVGINAGLLTALAPAWGGVAAGATIPAVGATGSQTVTPNAVGGISGMVGIHVGDQILVTDGVNTETVTVSAVTTTTFTATYAHTHGAGVAISTASLFNQTSQAICALRGGDVVVINAVQIGTGLASPAAFFMADVTVSASSTGL